MITTELIAGHGGDLGLDTHHLRPTAEGTF